jgi:hypothetical protein
LESARLPTLFDMLVRPLEKREQAPAPHALRAIPLREQLPGAFVSLFLHVFAFKLDKESFPAMLGVSS